MQARKQRRGDVAPRQKKRIRHQGESSGYPVSLPHVPSDHGGDVLAVMSAAHSDQHSPMLAEQGPCLVTGVVTMGDSSFTTKMKIHSDSVAVQLGCVALFDTGSPLESMKRAGATSAICERHTPPRFWGRVSKSPPLQTSAAVRLSVQFFHCLLYTSPSPRD